MTKLIFIFLIFCQQNNIYPEPYNSIQDDFYKNELNKRIIDSAKIIQTNLEESINNKTTFRDNYFNAIGNKTIDKDTMAYIIHDSNSFISSLVEYEKIVRETTNVWAFFYQEKKICSKFYKKLNIKFNVFPMSSLKTSILNKDTYINFEALYVYLNYLESIDLNTCDEYIKSLEEIKVIKRSLVQVSKHSNSFLKNFKINISYFQNIVNIVKDGSVNNIKLLDLRKIYQNIEGSLNILNNNVFVFFDKKIFYKLDIYSINLVNNFLFIEGENTIKFNNREKSMMLNDIYLSVNINISNLNNNRDFFAEFMAEIIYRYSELNEYLEPDKEINQDFFSINNFSLLTCNEQKAFAVYNFLNPRLDYSLNEYEKKYIEQLFGAKYLEEGKEKKFFELGADEQVPTDYYNFRKLSICSGKVLWTANVLNEMIRINTNPK